MPRLRSDSLPGRFASLSGLCAFALAQPLFDLLRGNESFLIEHEVALPERVLLVSASWVLPALALALVLQAIAPRFPDAARRLLHGLVGLAIACIVLPALPDPARLPAGALIAVLAALAHARWSPLRAYLPWSGLAALLFSALFVWPRSAQQLERFDPTTDRSIFLLILDELPLTNLLDQHDQLDAERFPNFARLAADAIWFRNATTANAYTERSIPILLSGKAPQAAQAPLLADHPQNLYTLLRDSHRLVVSERITRLCPPELALRDRMGVRERWTILLADCALLWAHRVAPAVLLRDSPSIEGRWFDYFGLREAARDPAAQLQRWLQHVEPGPRPLLGVLHLLHPHNPYVFHPDGARYAERVEEPFLQRTRWIDDEWATLQAWHRSRRQLQHVDRLLGEFLDRLQARGLYDDAVLAVVADHGASFRPGLPFRNPVEANWIDMLSIPMFVKLPQQAEGGRRDERLISSLDFLPTVLEAAGSAPPWPVDGESFLDPQRPGRTAIEIHQPQADPPLRRLPAQELARQAETLQRMAPLRQEQGASFGPHAALVGREVAELARRPPLDATIHLDAERSRLGELQGSLEGTADRIDLAVAMHGRVVAVTRTIGDEGAQRWLAVLPPGLPRGEPSFHAIAAQGGLRPLHFAAGTPSFLDRNLGLGSTASLAVRGFYEDFPEGDRLLRWTDGHGVLRVPIRPDQPAATLRLVLQSSAPDGCELRILVNGHELLARRIPAGPFRAELPLPRAWQREWTTIELHSSRFVPAERVPGSRDRRRLGVLLRELRLLAEAPVDTP